MMKVLVFWDVYGRIGRKAFQYHLPLLRQKYVPDFIVANIENISSGSGPIEKHIHEIEGLWIDVYTSWNHIFDREDDITVYLNDSNSKLIRPANFYESKYHKVPWKGYKIVEKWGKRLLVINLMSQVFLRDMVYNPFLKIDEMLEWFAWEKFDGILIDFHRETTSEIYAMGMFLDGKISFLFGTHTHIQTNDELVLPKGTWILTDVGMSGPLYSVIGAEYECMIPKFLSWIRKGKIEQALGKDYVVSAVLVEIDEASMQCKEIEKIRIRGTLPF